MCRAVTSSFGLRDAQPTSAHLPHSASKTQKSGKVPIGASGMPGSTSGQTPSVQGLAIAHRSLRSQHLLYRLRHQACLIA